MVTARRALTLVRCTHPEPALGVTLLVSVLALGAGRGWGTAWVFAAVLAGQFSVGWANDYQDRDLDTRAGRRDKPIAAGEIDAGVVRRAAMVAFLLAVLLSLASGPAAAGAHVFALLLAHIYNAGMKATAFSVVPYLLSFALVPAFVTLGLTPSHLPPAWATIAAGLIGASGHFTQTLGDFESDNTAGRRGLPHRLGVRGSLLAAAALLAGGAFVAWRGPGGSTPLPATVAFLYTAAVAVLVVVVGAAGRYKPAFRLNILAAGGALATFLLTGRPL